jgi:hypothetical protein
MRIAALLATHHLPEEAVAWFTEARSVFGELVIFIDEKRVTPGTIERAQKVGTRVVRHQANTWYESNFGAMARACESDWVFVLDYDEQLSPEWQQDGWRQILETTPFTHFWCPRRWTVPGGRYIDDDPWWPDFQLRLLRNNLEGAAFPTQLHDIIHVPGPSACFRSLAIHHHVLQLVSRSQREDKVRSYEQLRPSGGLSHYYLYEDYAPSQVAVPEAKELDLATEVVWMEKLSAHQIAGISLEVEAIPDHVSVSELFWATAQITNHTDVALGAYPPFSVRLAYHWIERETRRVVVFEGYRSGLFPEIPARAKSRCPMMILAPNHPGKYILQITMVQEQVCWFEKVQPGILREFCVAVT